MKPVNNSAAVKFQVATHPVRVNKLEAEINANAADGLFLQIHDADVEPADTAVPIKWWPASECAFKEFEHGELSLVNGCYVCLSTTGPTKTIAAGGNDKMDELQMEFYDPESPSGTTLIGDLTTQVGVLQVWADVAGPKRLVRAQVNDTGAHLTATRYLMLFAYDAPANGDRPLEQWAILQTKAIDQKFGENGRDVMSITGATIHDGCTLILSDTAGTLTKSSTGSGETVAIKAEFK